MGQVIENAIVPKNILKEKSKGCMWIIRVLFVFAFVSFAWIFFVSNSLGDAMYVIGHMFTGIVSPIFYLHDGIVNIGLEKKDLVFLTISLILLMYFDYASLKMDVIGKISNYKVLTRWLIYVCLIVWMIMNIPVTKQVEFIYFQF